MAENKPHSKRDRGSWNSILEKAIEFAEDLENRAFQGKSRGNRHLFRVLKRARAMAFKLNADLKVVELAAVLHDIGLVGGNRNHAKRGAEMAEKFLKKLGLEEETIEKVKHCIEAHEGEVEARSLEAMIVHDADALDKMGPLGVIRHTWKLANFGTTTEKIAELLEDHIKSREKRLYLEESRKIAKELNKPLKQFFKVLRTQL